MEHVTDHTSLMRYLQSLPMTFQFFTMTFQLTSYLRLWYDYLKSMRQCNFWQPIKRDTHGESMYVPIL